jgi:general stress protein 26
MIKDLHIAMLSTRGTDGKFHSRPMAISAVKFDGTLFFLTDVESGKVHDLENDPETIVTFSDDATHRYVALRGHGEIVTDRDAVKDHWSPEARPWFPKGADDTSAILIKVDIEDAEYWDAPAGRMVVLYAYAKAIVTGGKPGNVGDHGRIKIA